MGKTVSVSSGNVAMLHDRRDYDREHLPENVRPEMMRYNVYLKTCENEKDAFNSFFQKSVDEYNAKQSRADRKKTDYYGEIQKSKNGETPIYEYVFQIGNKDDTPCSSMDGLVCKSILLEYAKSFEKDNSNFHVLSSCIHMDESTPHLHIAFIPWAKGYKKGLGTRCSTSKALESMGYSGEERSMKFWKRAQEDRIEQLMSEHDMQRERKDITRGRLSVQLYKEVKEEALSDARAELQQMEQDMNWLQNDYEAVKEDFEEYVEARKMLTDEVSDLQRHKSALEDEINVLEGKLDELEVSEKGLLARFLEQPSVKKAFELFCERIKATVEKRKAGRLECDEGHMGMSQWKDSLDRQGGSAEPKGFGQQNGISAENENDNERF